MHKPGELFDIVERFCLGTRRLSLFGDDASVRPGWLTLGPDLTSSNLDIEKYRALFAAPEKRLLPFSQRTRPVHVFVFCCAFCWPVAVLPSH